MISVIIPTLNEAPVLGETIKGLRQAKKVRLEIIVSDGGSTDNTCAIARSLADRLVTDEARGRKTIARGRNVGAMAATGDFLVSMDADTRIPDPDRFFERALSFFEQNGNLAGLAAPIRVYPESATAADRFFSAFLNFFFMSATNMFRLGFAYGEFQMVRASAFRAVGGYREDLVASEDFDFFKRISKIGRTRMEPSLIVYHSGRRAHQIGWPKLLSLWMMNEMSRVFLGHSASKEWTPIR